MNCSAHMGHPNHREPYFAPLHSMVRMASTLWMEATRGRSSTLLILTKCSSCLWAYAPVNSSLRIQRALAKYDTSAWGLGTPRARILSRPGKMNCSPSSRSWTIYSFVAPLMPTVIECVENTAPIVGSWISPGSGSPMKNRTLSTSSSLEGTQFAASGSSRGRTWSIQCRSSRSAVESPNIMLKQKRAQKCCLPSMVEVWRSCRSSSLTLLLRPLFIVCVGPFTACTAVLICFVLCS